VGLHCGKNETEIKGNLEKNPFINFQQECVAFSCAGWQINSGHLVYKAEESHVRGKGQRVQHNLTRDLMVYSSKFYSISIP